MNEFEAAMVRFYATYFKHFHNVAVKAQNDQWTKDGTKEKTWIAIYNKQSISPALDKLLFRPEPCDESEVAAEMDRFSQSLNL